MKDSDSGARAPPEIISAAAQLRPCLEAENEENDCVDYNTISHGCKYCAAVSSLSLKKKKR